MPRKSSDYAIEIPVSIKDQTQKGARSVVSNSEKMVRDAERESKRQQSASDQLQRQRSSALLREWKKNEDAKTKITQQALKEREKLEQANAKASESLQRQRSAALLSQWRREQTEHAKMERQKLADAKKAAADYEASQDAMWFRVRNIAIAALAAIALAIAGLSVAIERAATFERLEQGLVAIMGSSERARKEIELLKETAKVPGLGFREAIQGSLSLQALGIQADRARRIIQAFGNAVAFTGGKNELDRILLQLTQMISAGRVITQDLRPIIQTAPIAGRALKDVFGTISPEKLNKMSQNVDEFVDKWVAGMERLPKAPNAAANAFENLGDTWDRFLIAIGKPFLPIVSAALEGLTFLLEKGGTTLGSLFELLLKYPGVLAATTVAMTAFGTALLFASTNAIPLIIAGITQAITFFVSLAGTVRLVGQVMIGTAGLIQGATATMVVATLGWGALAIAIGAVILALTQEESAIEKANAITLDQIQTAGQAREAELQRVEALKRVSEAVFVSEERHDALRAIIEQLDPTTQSYVRSLRDEADQHEAVNRILKEQIQLRQAEGEARLRVFSGALITQLQEIAENEQRIVGIQGRIIQQEELLRKDPNWASTLRPAILSLSQDMERFTARNEELRKGLTENQKKLVETAIAYGITRDRLVELLKTQGTHSDQIQKVLTFYDAWKPKVDGVNDSLKEQAQDLKAITDELKGLVNIGEVEIESKILDIVKTAKTREEARRLAQEALKGDEKLREILRKRREASEAEKAAREVFEPKPVSRATVERQSRDAEMVRSMRVVAEELSEAFQEEFGRAMKFRFGQTPLHTKLGYRHEAAFDISEDPRTAEGRFIMEWLRTQGITFRASLGREVSARTGRLISTGTHIHAGEMSGLLGRALRVNEGLLSPQGLERELERQTLVFAPWSGQMVTQEEYTRQLAANRRQRMVLSPTGAMVTPEQLAAEGESPLAQLPLDLERKWEQYYETIRDNEKNLAERRKDFGEEYKLHQSEIITELGHLEIDLAQFRKQAEDDQLTEQRRLVDSKREELDLLQSIRQEEDTMANGPINESLRIQLALLQDINDIRRRDEEAIKDYNRAQLEMADATVYHAQQADTAVARFLAGQESITEIVAGAKIGLMETTFDVIDRGLERVTSKMGILKDLVHDILSSFIRLALSQFFRTIFLGQGGGAGAAGGGIFGRGGGTQAGITNIPGIIQNLITGGGVSAPPSISGGGGASGLGVLGAAGTIRTAPGGAVQQAGGLLGALRGLGPALPLLGLGLGSGLGGQSRFGSVLGAAGGGILGLAGAALLGSSSAAGALGAIGSLGGLLPFTIGALPLAIPLILGAILLGRNAARRKNETQREALSQEVIAALQGMLSEAEAGRLTATQASSQFEELRSRYFQAISGFDSKTKRIATDWWNKPEHPPQVYWKRIQEAAKNNEAAANIKARMGAPVFASGGWSTRNQLIKVRPGEGIQYPGSNVVYPVFGRDKGYDTEYMYAPKGTRIINNSDMRSAKPMQNGGLVGVPSASNGSDLPELHIDELSIEIDADGIAKAVISSPFFKKGVIHNVKLGKKEKKLA